MDAMSHLAAHTMTPGVMDYFKSFYRPTTYLPPVDWKQELPKYICPDEQLVETAQKLVSNPQVQALLFDPLTSYDIDEVIARNRELAGFGFQEGKAGLHSFEHEKLPGWEIQAVGRRFPEEPGMGVFSSENGEAYRASFFPTLSRLPIADRVQRIVQDLKLEIVIPTEYAVPCDRNGVRHYFILSQKLELAGSTTQPTRKTKEDQIQLAQDLSLLIKKGGLAEVGIFFTKEGKLVLNHLEARGLLAPNRLSVEKCGRIGLCLLKDQAKGLEPFSAEVERHYQQSLEEYSVARIALSILCPILPLVFLVIAFVNRLRIYWMAKDLADRAISFHRETEDKTIHQDRVLATYQERIGPFLEKYLAAIEGIPFQSPIPDTVTLQLPVENGFELVTNWAISGG